MREPPTEARAAPPPPPDTLLPPPPAAPTEPGSGAPDDDAAELELHRPVTLGALLAGTALLRVAAVGASVSVQFYLSDLAGSRPSGVTIGLVVAAQSLSEMTFAPFLARYADRLGRRLFIVAGPMIAAAGVLLVSLAHSAAHVALARLVEGIGAAAFVPVALGTIAAATSHDRAGRARASGAFDGATLAGYAGGFAIGPFAYHSLGRIAFVLLAGLYIVAAFICLWLVPKVPPLRVSPLRTVLHAVFGPGPMRSFLPAWIGCFALIGAFTAHMPALLRHAPVAGQHLEHHLDERLIGVLLVSGIVLFLVGIALWTPRLTRTRPAAIMQRALPGAVVIIATLFVLNQVGLGIAPLALPVLALGIIWLAGFGPAAVTYLADCSESLVADRSALMSFYTVTLAAGGAVGAIVGGVFIRALGADGLLVFLALIFLVTFSLVTRLARADSARASLSVPAA
ncbi:MAG: MFS transporter [Candidatus Dormibacteraeota bacterium]|nr:MFS transporter [Candidatus Dormibacteraeota bacterium]